MVSPHDCDLCGVQEGTGWCSTCSRIAIQESERRHKAEAKRTRPESCGRGFKHARSPSLDDYDNR